jgi:hypothetical protein
MILPYAGQSCHSFSCPKMWALSITGIHQAHCIRQSALNTRAGDRCAPRALARACSCARELRGQQPRPPAPTAAATRRVAGPGWRVSAGPSGKCGTSHLISHSRRIIVM